MTPLAARLAAASAVALAVVALDWVGLPLAPVRVVAGLFLGVLAPGAALLLVVRPRFVAGSAGVVLSIALSLALLAILGVILDRTSFGLNPETLVISSAAVTAALLGTAVRNELTRNGRSRPGGQPASSPDLGGPRSPGGGSGTRLRRRRNRQPAAAPPVDASRISQAAVSRDRERRPTGKAGRIRYVARQTVDHLRDPLFRNAYALGLSGVVTSGLGVVYWAVAARLYPSETVGINASLLSLVTLAANIAQLNLRSAFGRFVPIAGRRVVALVGGGYLAAFLLAAVCGLMIVGALALAPGLLGKVELTPMLAWLVPVTVVLWTLFSVQDHALVAFRLTPLVPIENGVFALAKIVLLVVLAGGAGAYTILVSWTLPTAVGVVLVSGYLLARVVPREARAAARDASDPGRATDGPADDASPRAILAFVGADYVGSLFAIGASSLLPVIVLTVLGATPSAHFYIVSLIAMAAQLVPTVLATSLLVEVSSSSATFEEDGRRVVRQLVMLLGPLVIALVVLAEPILSIFGPAYAAEGATTLRLLALAGIPFSIINLAFIRLRLERRVRAIVLVQVALALSLVGLTALLIPSLGVVAIGVVTLATQSIAAAVLARAELGPLFGGLALSGGRTRSALPRLDLRPVDEDVRPVNR